MSFLTGKTKQVEQIPSDIGGLRKSIIEQLQKGGLEEALTGLGPGGDIGPYKDLFKNQLAPMLAQAKESAGTLTGSGMGAALGSTAGRATSGFLLDLLRQRASNFTNLLSGFGLTGVGPPQTYYQPGFLDYAMQGAAAAAPFFMSNRSNNAPSSTPNVPFTFGVDYSGTGGGRPG